MNSKEVRIGNYVDVEQSVHKITSITDYYYCKSRWIKQASCEKDYERGFHEIKPFKINDQWLKDLGFVRNAKMEWKKGRFILDNYYPHFKKLKYVHELQNLYYLYSGNELELVMEKIPAEKIEYVYNFVGGGWNSEYAYTKKEAYNQALGRWKDCPNLIVDLASFRTVSVEEYKTLLMDFD